MKKILGAVLRKVLPLSIYKLVANGFIIIPKYYKSQIKDLERYHTLSLEDSIDKDFMLMRKYGHILDKALHREDASPGHSGTIYKELKDLLEKLSSTDYVNDPTYKWAKDRLVKYELLQSSYESFVPFGNEPVDSVVPYEDLLNLIKQRRTNRDFLPTHITKNEAQKLKEVANWAANSCNKQPIKIFETIDPKLAKECLKCCKGGTGFGNDIPSFWAFTANSRAYVWPSEMYLPTLDVSLGAQNLFLVAQTLGITGCILSWAQKDSAEEKRLRELLNIPAEYVICFCAVMGRAKKNFCTPSRKDCI